MGQKPRTTLPIVARALAEARSLVAGSPTVDAARERLGGRAVTAPDVGGAVVVTSGLGVQQLGVVIFRRDQEVDVWIGAGRVRRLSTSDDLKPASRSELLSSLAEIADGAVIFASLTEGQSVRFRDGGGQLHQGLLVEKCRYGALVLDPDDKVIAVGFSGLSPA